MSVNSRPLPLNILDNLFSLVYFYLLILLSLSVAGISDRFSRTVNDLIWLPAGIGTFLLLYFFPFFTPYILLRVIVIVILMFVLGRKGYMGYPDLIALFFCLVDPFALVYPWLIIVIIGSVVAFHVFKNRRLAGHPYTVTVPVFLKHYDWLPISFTNRDGTVVQVTKNVNKAREQVIKTADITSKIECVYAYPMVWYFLQAYVIYFILLVIFQYPLLVQTP